MEQKFYLCKHCGNIITFVRNMDVPVICCGEKMEEIKPGVTDAAVEKHIPVVAVEGNKVEVFIGEVEHPMVDEHYIEWITLETEKTNQITHLKPGEKPKAEFAIPEGDKVISAHEYCNLHGLWKKEL